MKEHWNFSPKSIGGFFGDRDRMTVIYSVGKIRKLIDNTNEAKQMEKNIIALLANVEEKS